MKKSLDKRKCLCYNIIVPEWACNEVWLSLVERYVRDVEAASSNLVTSTKKTRERLCLSLVFFGRGACANMFCEAKASSHTSLEDRQACLAGEERGYHGAKRSYLVTSTRERLCLSLVFLVEMPVRTCFAKQKQVRIPRSEIAKLALFFQNRYHPERKGTVISPKSSRERKPSVRDKLWLLLLPPYPKRFHWHKPPVCRARCFCRCPWGDRAPNPPAKCWDVC